ncbi:ABC transporter substrate-binding protein [Acuticoccus sediminis]|uniref:ABC transporter substrate-binding protein n=1 Tax=Acuticoccus sediminis TaxID=2184697 RepID=A0A8B2NQS6_9HYPH|nr:ABC transporter substrate-binding protein [Acuticoccus sediminis]RAI02236.1 ABC transporter substrate-binding protein [Acuticoccus sediminis]
MPRLVSRLVLSALIAAASPLAASASTLVFCSEGMPETISPPLATTTTGINAGRQIFDYLIDVKPGTTELIPSLAQSWTISDDGLVYTFKLREGVEFHSSRIFTPTRTMNADDVLFSLNRQLQPDHPFHNVPGGSFPYFDDTGMSDLLKSVEKVDDNTVRMTLTRPDATFLANLALPLSAIMSAEYADALLAQGHPELLDLEPVGTGYFAFLDLTPDVAIRYRAFEQHWRGPPAVDTLVFSITPNASVRLTKLTVGECHVTAFPDPADVETIMTNPDLELLQQEGYNVGYLAMNVTKPPFDDARVRRAVAMAIDKKSIIDAVYRGSGVAAVNPLPPASWAYNEEIEDYPYDPDAAWALLADAGHAEGFETDLWYIPVSRPYSPNGKRIAEMIAADLDRIGIRVHLVTKEWGDYRTSLQDGEHTMALYGWTGDNPDPDNFLNILLGCRSAIKGGNNVAKWCDPDYDALVTEATLVTDIGKRAALYRQAQVIAHDKAPWVPIAHSVVFMAKRRNVKGYVMDPLDRHIFGEVRLSDD